MDRPDSPTHVAVVVGHDLNNVQGIISLTNELHDMLLKGQTYVLSPTHVEADGKEQKLLCVTLMPEEVKEGDT